MFKIPMCTFSFSKPLSKYSILKPLVIQNKFANYVLGWPKFPNKAFQCWERLAFFSNICSFFEFYLGYIFGKGRNPGRKLPPPSIHQSTTKIFPSLIFLKQGHKEGKSGNREKFKNQKIKEIEEREEKKEWRNENFYSRSFSSNWFWVT